MAGVTDTGFSNSYMTIRWLKECFDPATRRRAGRSRRLLFLDGPDIHTSVDFLEACWDRNIVCIIPAAHLSGVFQPLDVDFFNHLKRHYHTQIDNYHLGSTAARVPKAYFIRWFQQAWQQTTTSRQIRPGQRRISTHSVRSMTDAPSLLLGPSPCLRTLRPLIPPRPSRSSTADFEGTKSALGRCIRRPKRRWSRR